MTQSEGTSQGAGESSSGGSSSRAPKKTKKRKATTRARRGTGGAATRTRRKTTARTKKATRPTRRTATDRRKPATRTRRRRTAGGRRRRASQPAGLQGILNDLARRASRAGSTISDLSEGGTDAARRTLGTVSETSRQTIARVRREWDRLDTSRRVEFVAGLLAALAAATAGVRTLTKK